MANIKELKDRIGSITSTKQITKAMQMVAASKLKKAENRIISARPFANYTYKMLQILKFKNVVTDNPLLVEREDLKKELVLVVTADRGLCGAFNSHIIKKAMKYMDENPNAEAICLGKAGYNFLKKHKYKIIDKFIGYFNEMDFDISKEISKKIIDIYLNDDYRKIKVIYNEFKSAIQQNVIDKNLLPISTIESDDIRKIDYIYEPDEETVIDVLGKQYIDVELWRVMLESSAAEQAARMTAMDNATENANDLIQNLTLQYNKERQSMITTEIIEIASGAEALKKT